MPGWRLPDKDEARDVVERLSVGDSEARGFWMRTPGRGESRMVVERGHELWQLAPETRIETVGMMPVSESGDR